MGCLIIGDISAVQTLVGGGDVSGWLFASVTYLLAIST